jgi:filamentous hemagglutinin
MNDRLSCGVAILLLGGVLSGCEKVDITSATEASTSNTEQKFKQAGVSVSVSNPIINAIESVGEISRASSRTDDPRAQDSLTSSANPASVSSVGINVSLGSMKSQSDTHEETSTSAGSKVIAGDIFKAMGVAKFVEDQSH